MTSDAERIAALEARVSSLESLVQRAGLWMHVPMGPISCDPVLRQPLDLKIPQEIITELHKSLVEPQEGKARE